MDSKLDIISIFELLDDHKRSKKGGLSFFITFTAIIFGCLELEDIPKFKKDWGAEIKNNGKMGRSSAKSIYYRGRNLYDKYSIETAKRQIGHDLIVDQVVDDILIHVKENSFFNELREKVEKDISIPEKDKYEMLKEAELSVFLSKILLYETVNGSKVKKNKSEKKTIIEKKDKIDLSDASLENSNSQKNQQSKKKNIIIPPLSSSSLNLRAHVGNERKILERLSFLTSNPPKYIAFNSIIDNPVIGDERNFVRIKEVGMEVYKGLIEVEIGKEYEVVTYFHNNIDETLNASGKGIAQGVSIKTQFPTTLKRGERGFIASSISASNSKPEKVWDEAYIFSEHKVSLRYVHRSAKINCQGSVDGEQISSSMLFSPEGAFLGFNSLDGLLPGGIDYSGNVTYRFKVCS